MFDTIINAWNLVPAHAQWFILSVGVYGMFWTLYQVAERATGNIRIDRPY